MGDVGKYCKLCVYDGLGNVPTITDSFSIRDGGTLASMATGAGDLTAAHHLL